MLVMLWLAVAIAVINRKKTQRNFWWIKIFALQIARKCYEKVFCQNGKQTEKINK